MEDRGQDNFKDNVNFDEIVGEAEQRFRAGMETLNQWGAQARVILEKQPAAVLAGVAVLGFLTGLALRRALPSDERR